MLLKTDPNPKQLEALKKWADDQTSEILFGGAKNGGKSYLGGTCIFHDALVYPETMYFIARQTLADLRKYTIPTINEIFQKWGLDITRYARYNGQDNYFQCYNKSKVHFLECAFLPGDQYFERFGSMQMTRGWIEEVGEVNEMAKVNLKLSIGRWKNDEYNLPGKLLMTCNPKKNWLKYNYIDTWKKGLLPSDVAVILSTVYDNKHRQKGSEKTLEQLTGVARQRLLEGIWDYDTDDDTLILGEKILDLYTNNHALTGTRYITADVARFGKDKSVIFVWEGWRVIAVVILLHKKTTEVAKHIRELAQKYGVGRSNVIVDEDGVGGGVVDELSCNGFVNNSVPLPNPKSEEKENFDNLKSQCYYMLASKINEGEIWVQADLDSLEQDGQSVKELLNQELENVRKKNVEDDKKLGVLPKDKVRQLIGRSPDYSDTMMMRMWFELEHQVQLQTF